MVPSRPDARRFEARLRSHVIAPNVSFFGPRKRSVSRRIATIAIFMAPGEDIVGEAGVGKDKCVIFCFLLPQLHRCYIFAVLYGHIWPTEKTAKM